MAHARKQIREKFEVLCKGLPTTGDRVYASRVRPLQKDQEPSLLIYALREQSETHAMGSPATLLRTVTIAVEVVVSATGDFDDTLDQVAAEVEAVIGADRTLGGFVLDTMLTDTDIAFDGDSEMPIGHLRLSFDVQYLTTEADAETIV